MTYAILTMTPVTQGRTLYAMMKVRVKKLRDMVKMSVPKRMSKKNATVMYV
jgi:hypothetical protein